VIAADQARIQSDQASIAAASTSSGSAATYL
jgi:hypothetical protein